MERKAIVLNSKDNVATALADLNAGDAVALEIVASRARNASGTSVMPTSVPPYVANLRISALVSSLGPCVQT